jgi:pimeloyl-ACP methyl ester carboxylesterase
VVIPGIDGLPGSVAPIVEALARTRRVLLVDYSSEVEPSLEALGLAIANHLPERCDVVGQSIGTWLAAEVARLRPEAVRRVVLIATFTRTRTVAVRLSAAFTRVTPSAVYRRTTPALMRLTCGPVGDGGNHPFLRGVADSEQEGVARRTRWQVGRDASPLLQAITQPVAVFLGGSDRFVPKRRREFGRIASIFSRPGDRVTVIAGAGHVLLPSAAVAEAVAGIEEFLA